MLRRRGAEVRYKVFIFAHVAAVGFTGDDGKLIHNMTPAVFRFRRRQQVCFQNCAGVEREAADGDFRQAVFEADHLALLGHAQTAFQTAWRLRKQRRVGWRAATANRSAAAVEEGKLDASFFTGFDQGVLRLILRP
ncbi:Uncharacterised protein [Salmonella enterica subsp. enterica serovar Bovismorbificans]|uniref:Uncharacterized protein n=1 Tax=Salmonella enterica subsp. enterica serovar Bovismorbificans TaxID=58097 RepID=A0A655C398_SALET|nr:Uncharacterised protein [Salmonella enterica subsp. enterica serovar Bovismorbificans]